MNSFYEWTAFNFCIPSFIRCCFHEQACGRPLKKSHFILSSITCRIEVMLKAFLCNTSANDCRVSLLFHSSIEGSQYTRTDDIIKYYSGTHKVDNYQTHHSLYIVNQRFHHFVLHCEIVLCHEWSITESNKNHQLSNHPTICVKTGNKIQILAIKNHKVN